MIDLIYCGGGNRRFAEIAISMGFLYGSRSDDRPYFPIAFADLDYKKGEKIWESHVAFCREHQATLKYAVAPDVTEWPMPRHWWQLVEELETLAKYVIVVPKVHGVIRFLPQHWILGYSVPTSYGATELWAGEFAERNIHLLGGSPHAQMALWYALPGRIVSADSNMALKMATGRNSTGVIAAWRPIRGRAGHWWSLQEMGFQGIPDAPYLAFQISCRSIMQAWRQLQYHSLED